MPSLNLRLYCGLMSYLCLCSPLRAEIDIASGPTRIPLVELYTSEGCSSCPPAERWLNELKSQPGLWSQFIPIAFHVDYWDGLGWKDPYARAEHSERQRQHAVAGDLSQVYTPGMLYAGQEWRTWRRGSAPPARSGPAVGNLRLRSAADGAFAICFERGGQGGTSDMVAHLAILGFGLTSAVAHGENAGEVLHHDFVLLGEQLAPLKLSAGTGCVNLAGPKASQPSQRLALVAWVEPTGDPRPVQAVATWLNP